jgi:nucleoside-diphosphate-sugar epimerase
MKRVWLLFGANGWIGSMTSKILIDNNEIVYTSKSRVDNIEEVEKEIQDIKPTHVISWIGRTFGGNYNTIDYLEQPGKLVDNLRDNLFSIIVLAKLSDKYNFHLTSGGTGCIFEYDDLHPNTIDGLEFTEDDLPNFYGSSYSIVKGFTDRLLHLYPNVLNVRIRMPIDNKMGDRNFITKIVKYKKIHSLENSMSVLPDLLPIMYDMAKNNKTGTINLTNPGKITHNEILEMYKELVDPSHIWENVSSVDGLVAAKRSNNCLDTNKLKTMYPNVLPIKEAIRKCLLNIANIDR